MAADVAGLILGMQLLEPGFAVAPADGPPRVGRVRVPAAQEIDDAVTRVLNEASWEVTDVDPADWLTATKWTLPPLVAEAYRSNQDIVDRHADRLTPGVAQRMEAGRQVTPAEAAAAAQARDRWRAQLTALFGRFDLLVMPTLTILPPTLDNADDLLEGRCTLPVNLAGVPALALPCRPEARCRQPPARGRLGRRGAPAHGRVGPGGSRRGSVGCCAPGNR